MAYNEEYVFTIQIKLCEDLQPSIVMMSVMMMMMRTMMMVG